MQSRSTLVTTAVLLGFTGLVRVAAQGPLDPPAEALDGGTPTPSMKTLAQVEPRTALVDGMDDTPAVATSDPDYEFIIKESGSYYLTGNLLVEKLNGILIEAPGVSLDLRGFAITQQIKQTEGFAIEIGTDAHRCTVANGSIAAVERSRFDHGVICQAEESTGARSGVVRDLAVNGCIVGISTTSKWTISGCSVHGSSQSGIIARDDSSLEKCTVCVSGQQGIRAGERCILTNCIVTDSGFDGIDVANDAVVTGCISNNNGLYGIEMVSGVIKDCTANDNTRDGIYCSSSSVSDCTTSGNGFSGIDANFSSNVSGCTSNGNTGSGIEVSDRCLVTECSCYGNDGAGFSVTGEFNEIRNCKAVFNRTEGIIVSGASNTIIANHVSRSSNGGITIPSTPIPPNHSYNVIEGNTLIRNSVGLSVSASNNFVTRNRATASSSGIHYTIIANNHVGVIVDAPVSGAITNAGGVGLGSTDPSANFIY